MKTITKRPDRRVARTRHLLQQAFKDVSKDKTFAEITVQDITERANVNRGTFYAHFEDKYALWDSIIRQDFQHLLASKLPPVAGWDRHTVLLLVQTVMEYVKVVSRECRISMSLAPMMERATHEELTSLLLQWLKHRQNSERCCQVPAETIAHSMSWMILGAAAQWSASCTLPSERMANDVLLVMMEGVAGLAPDALPG